MLEGEGSFLTGPPSAPRLPVLALSTTDEDVVARVGSMFGRANCRWQPHEERWQTSYVVRATGAKAVAWMTALRPLMGARRQTPIDRAIASYDPRQVAILDDVAAQDALHLLAAGTSVRAVAERFGTGIWCIYDLRGGGTHRHLLRP